MLNVVLNSYLWVAVILGFPFVISKLATDKFPIKCHHIEV